MDKKENGTQPLESATNFVESYQEDLKENPMLTSANASTNGHLSRVATVSGNECAMLGELNKESEEMILIQSNMFMKMGF